MNADVSRRPVGIIGLGSVGTLLAISFLEKSKRVIAINVRENRESLDSLEERAASLDIEIRDLKWLVSSGITALFISVPGTESITVARELLPNLPRGTVYCDTSSKEVSARDQILAWSQSAGIYYCDGAVMDSVEISHRPIDLWLSGPGSRTSSELLEGSRIRTAVLDETKCMTTELKLTRSAITKGLAVLLNETLTVATALDAREEILESLTRFFSDPFIETAEMLARTLERSHDRWEDEIVASADLFRQWRGTTIVDDLARWLIRSRDTSAKTPQSPRNTQCQPK